MTEAKWLVCAEPQDMLDYLRAKVSDRRLRLLACAFCRRLWGQLRDRGRAAVEVAERFAEGRASDKERRAAWGAAREEAGGLSASRRSRAAGRQVSAGECDAAYAASYAPCTAAFYAALYAALNGCGGGAGRRSKRELKAQCELVREVFGNPFRPHALASVWRTADVARLAGAAYEERTLPAGTLDNHRLAVLADALEEAGCADAELLGHLRDPGPHVRGCWALDLLLGRS
jgi:hypothetical protein